MNYQGPRQDERQLGSRFVTKRIITNIAQNEPYLTRWSLWLPFGWSIKLHKITRADDDRCLHDHPWRFLRIILKGGYVEQHGIDNKESIRKPWRPWAPWRIYYCSAGFRHQIVRLLKKESWTLVLVGNRYREWGFFTKAGWIPWLKFINAARSKQVLWCDDGRVLNKKGTHDDVRG